VWARRDDGAWSIPKGELEPGEDPLAAARREFREELGQDPPSGEPIALGELRQPGGKRVVAWAVEGDLDVSAVRSGTFEMEWPPRSGRRQRFPEVDRAAWFDPETARRKLLAGQVPFVDRLLETLRGRA
jgi:predicted NUDIX family NTP pyrophosphohydrolase